MFILLPKRRNYTQAQGTCRNFSGVLADVTSEQRTDALSQLLATAGVGAAYVGMWSKNDSVFYSN
ncbi:jg23261, partial [Pararge aegeria aegeria]